MREHFSWNLGVHDYTFIPQMKDYLSCKTSCCGPMGHLKSQVSLFRKQYVNHIEMSALREEYSQSNVILQYKLLASNVNAVCSVIQQS